MTTTISTHAWSEASLFNKAKLFVQQMESHSDTLLAGIWSALTLELLARAALSHISPVLLAGDRNWRNITYALEKEPTIGNFRPRSIQSKELFDRIHELIPSFTEEVHLFCMRQAERRNTELHSGDLAFEKSADWRPRFYQACEILVESMDRKLTDFVSDIAIAKKMIESLKDTAAKSVNQDINAHKIVWSNKTEEERREASRDAQARATSDRGHRVECPACSSKALVQGEPIGPVETRIEDDEIVVRQRKSPSSFECTGCGLKITGFSRLTECRLGSPFGDSKRYTVDEYYSDYLEDYVSDYYAGYYQEYMNE